LYSCDRPEVRNNYTKIEPFTFKLFWMYFNCTIWKEEARQRIAEATYDLNFYFKDIGYQFNSYLTYYPCTGSRGNQNYNIFTVEDAANAVIFEIGQNYQQNGISS
jgi:hypothetical protein